jgi:hypothetical protein
LFYWCSSLQSTFADAVAVLDKLPAGMRHLKLVVSAVGHKGTGACVRAACCVTFITRSYALFAGSGLSGDVAGGESFSSLKKVLKK